MVGFWIFGNGKAVTPPWGSEGCRRAQPIGARNPVFGEAKVSYPLQEKTVTIYGGVFFLTAIG
ncbi:MAG: hypothetical protein A3J48_02070 [Candidatus Doudnabacteria bacterium RIFCSPHIGHO2_02_FULL_46_11]|uniref:Uncharacterized protein n=1 Tax=Candidatus Doudnabacteria bacterium RIFCSPHIGHO2_02_FULL_46_11 TaxID=1817832 RepID=A0A1F5P4Q6_9BACT|nr:MAG: hypothetical protein A3J48_02070 [Candidatus Doudnabacteria bacterium RIFCSPHIGHO2_02_FULL_46_11]